MPTPTFRQASFAASLLGPDFGVPPGLAAGTPPHRFEVYRRNVQAGLVRALAARFPVVQSLVGEAFFMAMARDFALRLPPASPVLLEYGRDLPSFIRGFAPAEAVPYLADVAALETARSEAWHAPSCPAAEPDALQADDLAEARLRLQPSMRLVLSPHPVLAIWKHHQDSGMTIDWQPQSVVVHRQGMSVVQEEVPQGHAAFFARLLAGETIGAAFHAAASTDRNFDASTAFAWLLARGLIVAMVPDNKNRGEQNNGTFAEHGAAARELGLHA